MLGNELGRVDESAKREEAERRHGGRLSAELLECRMNGVRIGAVLDLSPKGARLQTRSMIGVRPNDFHTFTFACERTKLRLRARVAWIRRTGLFRREIGVEFAEVDDECRQALVRIAALARQFAY